MLEEHPRIARLLACFEQKKCSLCNFTPSLLIDKLDGVGPVDNRPSPNELHHFVEEKKKKKKYLTPDT